MSEEYKKGDSQPIRVNGRLGRAFAVYEFIGKILLPRRLLRQI